MNVVDLLVTSYGIGDQLAYTTVVEALGRKGIKSNINMIPAIGYEIYYWIYDNNPYINKINRSNNGINNTSRNGTYIESHLNYFNLSIDNIKPYLYLNDEEILLTEKYRKEINSLDKPPIFFVTRHRDKERHLFDFELLLRFIDALTKDYNVFQIVSPEFKRNTYDKLMHKEFISYRDAICFINAFNISIGTSTGFQHVAKAFDKKLITISTKQGFDDFGYNDEYQILISNPINEIIDKTLNKIKEYL